jgi:hypothetical protein
MRFLKPTVAGLNEAAPYKKTKLKRRPQENRNSGTNRWYLKTNFKEKNVLLL